MIRLAADENFNNDILRGLRRVNPDINVVRVQDTEVYEADDPTILEWAAREGYILLTHDINTMTKYAYERIEAGLPMPGLLVVAGLPSFGQIIDELILIEGASESEEWANRVTYLPLR
jgi:hypothetical protein